MIAWRTALEQVFHLHDNPQAIDAMQHSPLPEGMASLIRLASDAGNLLEDAAQAVDMQAVQLQAYVADYLVAVCFYPHSSKVRVLGLNDSKNMALAKEHHRLLLKWLHPDRNPHNKQYAERVNQAWTWLKNQNADANQAQSVQDFSGYRHERAPLPKSRFPLFLLSALALAALLLAYSFWPDDAVYVYGLDSTVKNGSYTETVSDQNEEQPSWLERLNKPNVPANAQSPDIKPAVKHKVGTDKPTLKQNKVVAKNSIVEQNIQPVRAPQPPELLARADRQNAKLLETAVPEPTQIVDKKTITAGNNSSENSAADVEQAQRVLAQFSQSYQQGNLTQFMALFSMQARNNRGDRLALEQDYRNLFANSSRRSIRFSELQWLKHGKLALQAHYHTQVKWQNKWFHSTRDGQIELHFINENGKLRIQQILLGD